MLDLPSEKIEEIARAYFLEQLKTINELVYFSALPGGPAPEMEVDSCIEEAERLRKRLVARNYDPTTLSESTRALQPYALEPVALSKESQAHLHSAIARAQIEHLRIYAASLEGRFSDTASPDPLFKGLQSTALPEMEGSRDTKAAAAVGDLATRYLDHKKVGHWVPKTYLDNKRVLNWFVEMVGADLDPKRLTHEHIRSFRDGLVRLPSNGSKRGGPSSFVGQLARGVDAPRIAARTAAKYFEFMRSFINWCVEEEYLEKAPGRQIKIPKPRAAQAQDARHPFSRDQLTALFNSPLYQGCKSAATRSVPGKEVIRDGKYWIPLLALYTGARLGELVQLLVSDVKRQDGVPFLDISLSATEGEKSLKTSASKRSIPLHPELLKCGFLEFVQSRSNGERLFSEIARGNDGYYSHNFSKWFGRYMGGIGLRASKIAFHSLRHNFKDALVAADVQESRTRYLMGHADAGVHRSYGSGYSVSVLATDIARVSFGIDLSALHVSYSANAGHV